MADKLWFGLDDLAYAELTQDKGGTERVAVNVVSATGNGEDLLQQLQELGLEDAFCYGVSCSGSMPAASLLQLNELDDVLYAMRPLAQTRAGSVQSEAVYSMNVSQAWNMFNTKGSGVKIGVLSDSFDNLGHSGDEASYARDISTGDLPDNVQVLEDYLQGAADDEGRAMLQLIYDIAPEAELAFHTAWNGKEGFAQGIKALAAAGCDVIVDDVAYFAEPFFMDGIVSQAVDEVEAAGAMYFTSVGNYGEETAYESAFVASGEQGPDGGVLHDFDPGQGVDTRQSVTLEPYSKASVILQWDQPFYTATQGQASCQNDLDFFVYDQNGELVDESTYGNVGADPFEYVTIQNMSDEAVTYDLSINLTEGAEPGLLKWLTMRDLVVNEYATNSPSAFGHSTASGAIGVAASPWRSTPAYGVNPPELEDFSSDGPGTILFDTLGNRLAVPEVRATPLYTGPDGCSTTFFGRETEEGGYEFYGTSASAPNVAAVAGLMRSMVPTASNEDIRTALAATSVDMHAPGYDCGSGYGLVQADDALAYLTQGAAFDPVYEFSFGDVQFWTASKEEKLFVQASGAPYKGIGFGAATGEAAVDVYRFYSPITSDHFLTTSAQERDWVQANLADWYNYEGVGLKVYASEMSGTTELYRFYDSQDGVHYYTASKEEYAENLQTPGYVFEGVMGWVDLFHVA